MVIWDYKISEPFMEVFDSLANGKKDVRILDVAAGTGLSGLQVKGILIQLIAFAKIGPSPTDIFTTLLLASIPPIHSSPKEAQLF